MTQENASFRWNRSREQAARLVAQDALTDEQIAAEVGVTRRTLARWKRRPEFAARVCQSVDAFRQELLAQSIAAWMAAQKR